MDLQTREKLASKLQDGVSDDRGIVGVVGVGPNQRLEDFFVSM